MKKRIGSYPRVRIEGGGRTVVSQAGGVLLVETFRKAGLEAVIAAALTPWRKPHAVHDPGKILMDVALAVALGRDCLADVAMLRAEPAVFGPVASAPTVSRLIDTLAASGKNALRVTGRLPNSSSVIGCGPGPRTASAPPGPLACATCPCTARPRTGSGWRSCRSLSTCWPGCRCSP